MKFYLICPGPDGTGMFEWKSEDGREEKRAKPKPTVTTRFRGKTKIEIAERKSFFLETSK